MTQQDELEIRNLIARIAWLTDKWTSPEEYLYNCTDDFSWQIEGMPAYVGHEGMARRLREMQQQGICGPGLPTRHCVTSVEVMSEGEADKAKARSFVIMMTYEKNTPLVAGYGEYHDELRRERGRWLIAKRFCIAFWRAP